MAETPEEVALRLLEGRGLAGRGTDASLVRAIASALRAQYVAGLERARVVTAAFDGPEAAAISRRIRELAEQAKREKT